eukprot:Tbor_TRINITY_DN4155_c0_g1::TRINITY_DN4155_c0_g1_i1::g.26549::m.26549/K14864/FTSJ1, TRM7; tRNA (cytidine32/guanosine34-2'-O)-methyltransferase
MGRASKDKRDIYYRKAKEEGYRARSAYKLLQIDEEMNIFEGVTKAVDLCAAPGSWSQVLASRIIKQQKIFDEESSTLPDDKLVSQRDARIVAVDLQEMAPIDGVSIIQGDITTNKTAEEVIRQLGDCKGDLVVCDGAPDVTGLHELDEYVQHQLLLAALNITTIILKEGGDFVAKIFRGPNTPFLCAKSEIFFKSVSVVKPKSSRNASMESFIVCRNFTMPKEYVPRMIDPCYPNFIFSSMGDREKSIVTFLSCGDLSAFDSDACFDTTSGVSLKPSHPPSQAPYLEVVNERRNNGLPAKRGREEMP